ncbi:hypothetical protein ANN_05032 [Periplaneta americana]|uniref:Per a allergen n=1 Tax=Periplaneta americana TaxID=6978 RepID=A0ABQ8TA43_PERAM|nr:hypothetical protein ANN_05032 [Periplaneta americana]
MAGLCEDGNAPPGSLKAKCDIDKFDFRSDDFISFDSPRMRGLQLDGRLWKVVLGRSSGAKQQVGVVTIQCNHQLRMDVYAVFHQCAGDEETHRLEGAD